MKTKKNRKSIEAVANMHNISEEEVIREIETCISQTWRKIQEEDNKKAMKLWEKIPSESEIPTAEEFISYIAEIVREEVEKKRC